jgi:hypothetical protein
MRTCFFRWQDVRTRVAPLLSSALVVTFLAGCGSTSHQTHTTTARSRAPQESPRQLLNRAVGALDHVHSFSVHSVGTQLDGARTTLEGEFALPGRLDLALTQGAESARVIVVNQHAYLRANRAFLLATAPPAARLAGKWLRLPATAPGIPEFYAWTRCPQAATTTSRP